MVIDRQIIYSSNFKSGKFNGRDTLKVIKIIKRIHCINTVSKYTNLSIFSMFSSWSMSFVCKLVSSPCTAFEVCEGLALNNINILFY